MPPIGKWIDGLSPSDPASKAARATLEYRLDAVLHMLPQTATHIDDVENVHQLRIATRRAGAALDLYADLIPARRRQWMAKNLKRIRHAAGKARDFDVLAGRLAEDDDCDSLCDEIKHKRRKAMRPLKSIYKCIGRNGKLKRRAAKLIAKVRPPVGSDGTIVDAPFHEYAVDQLKPLVAQFWDAAPHSESGMDELHRFRIRGKQLRYAMELLVAAFPESFKSALYPQIEQLQEYLGRINDHCVAIERYQKWLHDAHGNNGHAVLERQLRAEEAWRQTALREFFDWWTPERVDANRVLFADLLAGRATTRPTPLDAIAQSKVC